MNTQRLIHIYTFLYTYIFVKSYMFLTYPLRRETLPATIRSAICHFCYPSNCSKFLLMRPVWASFYC
ncbi:TPA: hypothetical protein HH163_003006 [Escherichia coli]|nr:hypothetical protein [Escherichia coli]